MGDTAESTVSRPPKVDLDSVLALGTQRMKSIMCERGAAQKGSGTEARENCRPTIGHSVERQPVELVKRDAP